MSHDAEKFEPQPPADHLFDLGAPAEAPVGAPGEASAAAGGGKARLRVPVRDQIEFRAVALDKLLPDDHEARAVWEYVCGMDLSPLLKAIRAVEHRPGHPPADPRVYMSLWLYATLQGVGSARRLANLCKDHIVYQWICGGVTVNHNTLAAFRVDHRELLNKLLTDGVAGLLAEGLVAMSRVAQDGMRVRADAGAGSFHRRATLEKMRDVAAEQVSALEREVESDPGAESRRNRSAQQRAARERAARIKAALEQMPEQEAKKGDAARVSSTDPDARVMKFADGGFRPGFNAQLATDTQTQVIVGVDVTNVGSDKGQLPPMVEQLGQRYEKTPDELLADGGFAKLEDIEAVSTPKPEGPGCTVYAPVPEPKKEGRDPHEPLPRDGPAVAEWRERMGTQTAKDIYKQRASTAECVNAQFRNHGLYRVNVRGREKVLAVLLLHALAHNIRRAGALRKQAAAATAAAAAAATAAAAAHAAAAAAQAGAAAAPDPGALRAATDTESTREVVTE